MATPIPSTMRCLVLAEYRQDIGDALSGLEVVERPTPRPKRAQVLVRVDAAACNPSDLLLLQGKYGSLKSLPTVPGWEGTGHVVASGRGPYARWLVGKRVACALQSDRDGTWAEYFVADARSCLPLRSQMSRQQSAGLIINPFTAWGLLDTARREGHAAAVQTAAASQLGRMLLTMAGEARFPLINIVRRDDQVQLLNERGAKHVLNSSAEDFVDQLKSLTEELHATAAFDAVGGEMTGTLHNALPSGSTIFVYGNLAESPCAGVDPIQVIFQRKTITGFYLGDWMRTQGILRTLLSARRIQQMFIDGRIETSVRHEAPLASAPIALKEYVAGMTKGKVLICPHAVE